MRSTSVPVMSILSHPDRSIAWSMRGSRAWSVNVIQGTMELFPGVPGRPGGREHAAAMCKERWRSWHPISCRRRLRSTSPRLGNVTTHANRSNRKCLLTNRSFAARIESNRGRCVTGDGINSAHRSSARPLSDHPESRPPLTNSPQGHLRTRTNYVDRVGIDEVLKIGTMTDVTPPVKREDVPTAERAQQRTGEDALLPASTKGANRHG